MLELTTGGTSKKSFQLTERQLAAFNDLRSQLISAPVLELFRSDRPTRVEVDSCSEGVGAVLSQQVEGFFKPVAYYSKKFPAIAKAYASKDAEAYGIYLAVLHWRVWLLGIDFVVNHQPNMFEP